jgi:hypothetical protein
MIYSMGKESTIIPMAINSVGASKTDANSAKESYTIQILTSTWAHLNGVSSMGLAHFSTTKKTRNTAENSKTGYHLATVNILTPTVATTRETL